MAELRVSPKICCLCPQPGVILYEAQFAACPEHSFAVQQAVIDRYGYDGFHPFTFCPIGGVR
jgi:hypothetical protein